MRVFFGFLLFLLTIPGISQEVRYVEEIAFYHFTNLLELEKLPRDLGYYMPGTLRSDTTGHLDTVLVKTRDTLFVESPFPGVRPTEKKDLEKFEVPASFRGRKSAAPLQVKHFLKSGGRYFVHFSGMLNEFEGVVVIVVLDMQGNLTHYKTVAFQK